MNRVTDGWMDKQTDTPLIEMQERIQKSNTPFKKSLKGLPSH